MTLGTKLLAAMLPLAAVSSCLTAVLARRAVSRAVVDEAGRRGLSLAAHLAEEPALAQGLGPGTERAVLPALLGSVRQGAEYAMVLDAEGRVAAHSDLLEKGRGPDEAARAALAAPGPRWRRVETPQGPLLDVSAPVWEAGAPADEAFLGAVPGRARLATVRLGLPLARELESAGRIARDVVWVAVLLNAAALGLMLLILRWLLRPLPALARGLERLGAGGVGTEVPVAASDELGDLARGFNRMSAQLAKVTVAKSALDAKAAELERSNRELEQYAYAASHDLQEPLRTVASFAELLAERYRGRLDAEADRLIGRVSEGARRMQTLIRDLLSLSRAGEGALRRVPVDLEAALAEALADLEPALREGRARVSSDPLPTVPGDRGQLVQVLRNLLSNAVKFRRGPEPQVRVLAREEAGAWVIGVSDDGIGIEARHQEQIFLMFRRLHPRAEYPGSGIGLALCRKIVERHGGRVWVESEPGRGATFYFSLPKEAP